MIGSGFNINLNEYSLATPDEEDIYHKVVDLNIKVLTTPKRLDRVLVRNEESDNWEIGIYDYEGEDEHITKTYNEDNIHGWIYCIVYDGNEHLLGKEK